MITNERLGEIQISLVGAGIKQHTEPGPQPMGLKARELVEIVRELSLYRQWREIVVRAIRADEEWVWDCTAAEMVCIINDAMPARYDEPLPF